MPEPTQQRTPYGSSRCCDEWPECSHVLADAAERHRQENPGCVCLFCMDALVGSPPQKEASERG